MSQKTDLGSVWQALENEIEGKNTGICRMIVSTESLFRVYLGINCISKVRLFIVEFPMQDASQFDVLHSTKGLQLNIETKGDLMQGCFACFASASNIAANDIFTSFAQDVIITINKISDKNQYTKLIVRRLELWKSFFENTNGLGLTQAQQTGLFGELDILEKLMKTKGTSIVTHWKGPESSAQDFQFNRQAVEVKSTTNEYSRTISISNMEQLNKLNREKIYLIHNRYDVFQDSGVSLPEIIDSIHRLISDDDFSDLFDEKLLKQGYYKTDSNKYKTRYVLRSTSCFDTDNPFPKITCEDVPEEIVDVSYKIDLAQCSNYLANIDFVFSKISMEDIQ